MVAAVETLLFVGVALIAFAVGRAAGRIEAAHRHLLGRSLHPTSWRAIVDRSADEYVRLVHDAPYDWDQDAGLTEGDSTGADDRRGTD